MFVRLEAHRAQSLQREGIYQIIDPSVINEVCMNANLLPVPNKIDIVPVDDVIFYWFTLEGWYKYGQGFLELLFEPEGVLELEKLDSPLYLLVYNTEVENDLFKPYEDDYQIALMYENSHNSSIETYELCNKKDLEVLQQKHPELFIYF